VTAEHPEPMAPEVQAAWAEEIRRRLEDLQAGRVQTVSWESVHQELVEAERAAAGRTPADAEFEPD